MKFDLRVWLLILITLVSSWYLFSPMVFKRAGVSVVYVDGNHKCGDIVIGDRITRVSGQQIKTKDEFLSFVSLVKTGEHVTMLVNNGPGGCTALDDGEIGIKVDDAPSKFLKFGLDIYGGKRVWLSVDGTTSETDLESIRGVIEERAKIWGASGLKTGMENGRLYVDVLNVNDVHPLLSMGVLEGRIEETIKVSNGVGQIKIESEYYDLRVPVPAAVEGEPATIIPEMNASNETIYNGTGVENVTNMTTTTTTTTTTIPPQTTYDYIIVEESEYDIGSSFMLGGVSFKVLNATNSTILLSGFVFGNEDVKPSEFASSYIRYDSGAMQYQYYVPVDISEDGIAVLSKIVSGMPSVYVGGVSILEGMLVFTVDGEEVNRLTMPTNMASQDIKSLNIIGFGSDSKEALVKKKIVEMALVGSMGYGVEIDETGEYVAGGKSIIYGVIGIFFSAAVILCAFPYIYYKGRGWFRMSSWSVLLFFSIIFNVFGIAALSQSVFTPGWVLDGASMVGILMVGVWTFVWFILTPSAVLKRRNVRIVGFVNMILLLVGFVLVFTQFSGFGIAAISGVLLKWFVSDPSYKKLLSGL